MVEKLLIGIGIVFVSTIIGLFIWAKIDENKTCRGGRDIVAEFGQTCQYSILGNGGDYILFYREEQETIETNLSCFKEFSPFVYAIGDKGYTKLNYNTGEIIQHGDINIFNENDKNIFKNLLSENK